MCEHLHCFVIHQLIDPKHTHQPTGRRHQRPRQAALHPLAHRRAVRPGRGGRLLDPGRRRHDAAGREPVRFERLLVDVEDVGMEEASADSSVHSVLIPHHPYPKRQPNVYYRDSAMHWGAYKGELNIVQLLHHLGLPVRASFLPVAFGGRSGLRCPSSVLSARVRPPHPPPPSIHNTNQPQPQPQIHYSPTTWTATGRPPCTWRRSGATCPWWSTSSSTRTRRRDARYVRIGGLLLVCVFL